MGKTFTAKYRYRKGNLASAVEYLSDAYNNAMFNCENLDLPSDVRKTYLRTLGNTAENVKAVVDAILQEAKEDDDPPE